MPAEQQVSGSATTHWQVNNTTMSQKINQLITYKENTRAIANLGSEDKVQSYKEVFRGNAYVTVIHKTGDETPCIVVGKGCVELNPARGKFGHLSDYEVFLQNVRTVENWVECGFFVLIETGGARARFIVSDEKIIDYEGI